LTTHALIAPAAFDRFWAIYPRRVAKRDALKAWIQLAPSADLVDAIMVALGWQVTQPMWLRDGGQYVPYPASWIRSGRWDDEPPPPARGGYAPWECPHEPHCKHRPACDFLLMRNRV